MAKRQRSRPTGFDLKRFYKQLDIPQSERQAVTDCLTRGLARYYRHIYGYDKYGPSPSALISERMTEPYILGFGAVEVIRHEALSPKTQLKIIQYTFGQIDATAEYGTPHGLPALLSFLASAKLLESAFFRSVMIAVDFGGELFDDWQIDEVRRLLDWLIAKTDLPDPERLWWLWHITMHSEPPHICKALAEWVLAHPALPAASKHALCEAWLADAWAGQPPAQWAAMQALLQGDAEAFTAHATSAGLPIPEGLPTRDAIEADYDFALDALLDGEGEVDEAPLLSLHMLRKMLIGPLGFVSITPSALKRAGVVALPRLGEDPLAVCQKYIATNSNYYADTFNLAVAELIRTYYTRMPQHEVRALVEHGLKVGSAPVRKTYYQLGAEMYGEEFMARAAHDNARSVREWAAKKASGPAKRGRKPKAERRT